MAAENIDKYELLVCVSGGIAAYKVCSVVSALVQRGAGVKVAMTASASKLVGAATFRALSGRAVYTDLWSQEVSADIEHIGLSERADLVVVAPATANILAKMAGGIADDLVSTTLLATEGPVLLVPAMNVNMWGNPATEHNVAVLKERGHVLVGPESGWQACGKVGMGRMSEPEAIVGAIEEILRHNKPKSGS